MGLNNDEIKEKLSLALSKLYVRDWYLLENNAHERSLTHKFAEYLQELFPNYDVDCEYNLDIKKRKKWLPERSDEKLRNILVKLKDSIKPYSDRLTSEIDKLQVNFYPDIIVHKRGTNKHNLLIIEAKKSEGNQSFDVEKLESFTHAIDNIHKYNYQIGALIKFDVANCFSPAKFTEPIYYINGKKQEEGKS